MALTLCLLYLKSKRPEAEYIIWPRLDQKTVVKCMQTANLKPIIVQGKIVDDMIVTDLVRIRKILEEKKGKVLCVFS